MKKTTRNPWAWIPTLYFAEGIPYVVAMTVAVIMFKRLGISNTISHYIPAGYISPGSSSHCGVLWLIFSRPSAGGSL